MDMMKKLVNARVQKFEHEMFGEIEVLESESKFYFPAIEVAEKLGYTNPRKAVIDHCKQEGVTIRDVVSQTVNQYGKVTEQFVKKKYITEGNMYRLIARSKLETAQAFERWVFDDVLPSIRANGSYSVQQTKPKTELEILQMSINQLVEQERRINQLETAQQQIIEKQTNIVETFALTITDDWRKKTNDIINRIAKNIGGTHRELRKMSYDLLEKRMRCNLSIRLSNIVMRMLAEGATKSATAKLNMLDVISNDTRLVEAYISIVKEMAARYEIAIKDLE